jgi:16S rRNA (guanine(966)-N(2))-methyltransferase RsmD
MSGLRVIGGTARGRKLCSVPGSTTRPITDRVKEALFNILGADIRDARLLDLFAGTGSVGIEALSRGAGFVQFIDLDWQAVATIKANLETTGLGDRAQVLQMSAFAYLERTPHLQFDYAYVAPPQYKGTWKQALQSLDAHPGWLSEDAWIIAQIHPREYETLSPVHFSEFDQRKYGSTLLVFFQVSTLEIDSGRE